MTEARSASDALLDALDAAEETDLQVTYWDRDGVIDTDVGSLAKALVAYGWTPGNGPSGASRAILNAQGDVEALSTDLAELRRGVARLARELIQPTLTVGQREVMNERVSAELLALVEEQGADTPMTVTLPPEPQPGATIGVTYARTSLTFPAAPNVTAHETVNASGEYAPLNPPVRIVSDQPSRTLDDYVVDPTVPPGKAYIAPLGPAVLFGDDDETCVAVPLNVVGDWMLVRTETQVTDEAEANEEEGQ